MADNGKHTAGAFDIRNIIGALLGIYGLLLLLASVLYSETDNTGGINANLWAGLAMLVVGLGFMAWAKARPIVVPEHIEHDDRPVHGH